MRALCSQIEKWRFFSSVRDGILQNGHFKNVQNRFPKNKPEKVEISLIYKIEYKYIV